MTSIAAEPTQPVTWPVLRAVGRVAAYAGAPLSFAYGPALPVPEILVPLYVITAIGFVALLRGASMGRPLMAIAWMGVGWYFILLAIDLVHGGPLSAPLEYRANLFASNFVLLALPFFVVGLRESGVEMRYVEWAAMPSIVFIAGYSVYEFVIADTPRPSGLTVNPIPFALICAVWSLLLFARALSGLSISWTRLVASLIGLVPIALSGTKLVWACVFVSYGGVLARWIWRDRRWKVAAVAVPGIILLGWILSQASFVSNRISELTFEVDNYLTSGFTGGATFGLRVVAALGGWRAFLERPLLGYGMTHSKLAATEHQLPGESPFGLLFHLHNEYVTFLVAFGILGLAFVLTFVAAFAFAARLSTDPAMKTYGYAICATVAIFMGAEVVSYHSWLQGLLYFVLGLLLMSARDEGGSPIGPKPPP